MNKKGIFALVLAALMTAGIVAGCGSDKGTDGSSTAGNSTKGVTVTTIMSQAWLSDSEKELAEKFKEETGITMDLQVIPQDQYTNILMTRLNSNECTDMYGLMSSKFDYKTQINAPENAVDLSDMDFASRLDPLAKEHMSVDGKLYGFTLADINTTWCMVYNKDLFKKYNLEIPITFDEFLNVCETLKSNGVTPLYEAVSDGWHHVLYFPEVGPQIEKNNPGFAEKLNNNEATFAENADCLKALEQVKELADKGYFDENYMTNTVDSGKEAMINDECAMFIQNQAFISQMATEYPDADTSKFGYFDIPILDNHVLNVNPSCNSRLIYSKSPNIDAAKKYIDFITSQENLQYLIDNESGVLNLPYEGLTSEYPEDAQEYFDSHEESGIVYQTDVIYLNPQWNDIGADISAMWIGQLEPIDVLKNIDKRRAEQAASAEDEHWK